MDETEEQVQLDEAVEALLDGEMNASLIFPRDDDGEIAFDDSQS